jgi:hypothetical protein|tara:strand:+ start:1043 stop:1441 length:399 start_codon:yes stop_codon:yes gene_type:complete
MKLYCPTCGSGTEYSLHKPKFCGSCGESFSSIGKASAKKVFKTQNPPSIKQVIDREEDEEEEFIAPVINRLDFEMQGSDTMNSYKIQDIVGSHPNALEDGYEREKDTSYSKETITQDFLRDAGSSRRSNAET